MADDLLSWCRNKGVIAPKLKLVGTGVHRGLIALEPIHPSETLLTIPSSLLISRSSCFCDPFLARVYQEQARLFDHQEDAVLAVFLAFHKAVLAEKSEWWIYLKSLPEIEVISDWEEKDLAELQDVTLIEQACQRREESNVLASSIVTKLCLSYPKLFPADVFTESLFLWAYKNVASRGFGSRVDEVQLVPLADMFNHSNESRTKYELFKVPIPINTSTNDDSQEVNDENTAGSIPSSSSLAPSSSLLPKETDDNKEENSQTFFRMYSTSESTGYAAGEMVTFSYGRRDNAHLLMEYGFALENNEHEKLILYKPPLSQQALTKEAKAILESEQYVNGPFQLPSSRLDGHLLSYFRAISLSQSIESYAKWEKGGIRSLNHPFSVEGEQRALALYSEYLSGFLSSSFPTSQEDDEARLKIELPGSRISLALQYRLEKKHLLQRHVILSTARLTELNYVIASYTLSSAASAGSTVAAAAAAAAALDSLPIVFGARKKSEGKQAIFLQKRSNKTNDPTLDSTTVNTDEEGDVSGFKLSDLSGKSSDIDENDD
jgi:hypothetical protein